MNSSNFFFSLCPVPSGHFLCVCPAERSHAPDPVHDPGLLPVDSVEEHFLMDAGSYDEVAHSKFLPPDDAVSRGCTK